MQHPPRSGWLGLSCHPDVQHVRACFRHAPRDRLDAADARDADLAGWGGFNKIYPRHVDPSVGVRLVHLVVQDQRTISAASASSASTEATVYRSAGRGISC
ncbi:hypothetical protein GW17_00049850 [Ensete ventricosum]|nr:hypothetical protein GW17_00049850 [Ensete ventricosum]